MRIRTKLLIVFFITSLVPLIFLSYINFDSTRKILIKNTQDKLETIATLEESRIREIGMDPKRLASITTDYKGLGKTGEVIVAKRGENGSIDYLTPRRFEKFADRPSVPMGKALNNEEGFFPDAVDYRGQQVVAITRYISDLGWGIVVKIDRDEAFQSVNELRDVIIIFSFILILLVVMITLLFVYSITAPLINLASVAKQVKAGDLSKRALVLSRDDIGDLSMAFNKMLDVIQQSHENLEKKVSKRTRELEEVNKDLESFSYSVSHDLRAPLRAVDGFSQIVEEDYAGKLDEKGKEYIAKIRHSTKQMGTLIDDLLTFSRLGRKPIEKEQIDMTSLTKEVFDEQMLLNSGRKIKFTCSELPSVYGDPSLIRQVWANLLSNAIKFTRKKDPAIISIGSVTDGNKVTYFVKDNGVGFDMRYVGKLFGVFQRLHDPAEFEGTGVGLAIVRRIVTKHGGKAWAEGEINQGATFYFSLSENIKKILI